MLTTMMTNSGEQMIPRFPTAVNLAAEAIKAVVHRAQKRRDEAIGESIKRLKQRAQQRRDTDLASAAFHRRGVDRGVNAVNAEVSRIEALERRTAKR